MKKQESCCTQINSKTLLHLLYKHMIRVFSLICLPPLNHDSHSGIASFYNCALIHNISKYRITSVHRVQCVDVHRHLCFDHNIVTEGIQLQADMTSNQIIVAARNKRSTDYDSKALLMGVAKK